MRIVSVSIKNFRSFVQVQVPFEGAVSVVVGENNVGKTSLFVAMESAIGFAAGRQPWDQSNVRPGATDAQVTVRIDLNGQDQVALARALCPDGAKEEVVHEVLHELGSALRHPISLTFSAGSTVWWAWVQCGPMFVHMHGISGSAEPLGSAGGNRMDMFLNQLRRAHELQAAVQQAIPIEQALGRVVKALRLDERFRMFREFRSRPLAGPGRTNRKQGHESFDGTDTVDVLFSLKNNVASALRRRYGHVQQEFAAFFPGLSFELVEQEGGLPDIQIYKNTAPDEPIRLDRSGAGITQILTILTNLIAREGDFLVVDTPELQLHPHARRRLNTLIEQAATRNQVFVITHDGYFVPPTAVGLARLFTRAGAPAAACIRSSLAPKLRGQFTTAMKHLGVREMVFARAVLLVEDESMLAFFSALAPRFNVDLNAHGISVIAVNGHSEFPPYEAALTELEIPCVRMRDKPWGPEQKPPAYWSFGPERLEIEDFLKKEGFADLLTQAEGEVGKSKQRIAGRVGELIATDRVPTIFKDLLKAVIDASAT